VAVQDWGGDVTATQIVVHIVVWTLIGVLLHDAVFAPICVALGFRGRRLLPHKWWTPVLVAVLMTIILLLLGDYHAAFWIALGVVWGSALLYLVGDRLVPADEHAAGRDASDLER
jgi:hypothetical protein